MSIVILGVPLILWVTHTVVAVISGGVVYLVTREGRPMATGSTTKKSALAIILLSLTLVILGVQVRAAQHDADQRRVQQSCLNRFSADVSKYLVDTLNKRVAVNAKRDKAQADVTATGLAQAKAGTAVFLTVAGLIVDHPPTKRPDDFVAALKRYRDATTAFNKATKRFNRIDRQAKIALSQTGTPSKPYDPPKVACVR